MLASSRGDSTVTWGLVASNVSARWEVAGAADVDSDGKAEILFQNLIGDDHVSPGTTYFANIGVGGFESWGTVTAGVTADWHVA